MQVRRCDSQNSINRWVGITATLNNFHLPGRLKADLDAYAALHAQTYGEAVDAVTLIPHVLAAFMVGDRGFRKGERVK